MHVEEFFLEHIEVLVIQIETHLEGTIRHPSLTFEQFECLGEDFIEGHRPPSRRRYGVQQTVWEWEKPVGLVIPQMGDKRKPQAWPRGTAPCHGARHRGGGPASRVAPADAAWPGAVAVKAAKRTSACPPRARGKGAARGRLRSRRGVPHARADARGWSQPHKSLVAVTYKRLCSSSVCICCRLGAVSRSHGFAPTR